MDIKLIKGYIEMVSMIISQWRQAGKTDDLEMQFILRKLEEIRNILADGEADACTEKSLSRQQESPEENGRSFEAAAADIYQNPEGTQEIPAESGPAEAETPACCVSEAVDKTPLRREDVPADGKPEESAQNGSEEPLTAVYAEATWRGKLDKKTILSLYEDDPAGSTCPKEADETVAVTWEESGVTISAPEDKSSEGTVNEVRQEPTISTGSHSPAKTSSPAAETEYRKVLGEVINPGYKALGDSIAPAGRDVASQLTSNSITSLRKAIGVNDKYLILQDLFAGDHELYDETLDRLDEFADLNEAMLWIHDNCSWNSNSQGAKLLVDMLVLKLM